MAGGFISNITFLPNNGDSGSQAPAPPYFYLQNGKHLTLGEGFSGEFTLDCSVEKDKAGYNVDMKLFEMPTNKEVDHMSIPVQDVFMAIHNIMIAPAAPDGESAPFQSNTNKDLAAKNYRRFMTLMRDKGWFSPENPQNLEIAQDELMSLFADICYQVGFNMGVSAALPAANPAVSVQ